MEGVGRIFNHRDMFLSGYFIDLSEIPPEECAVRTPDGADQTDSRFLMRCVRKVFLIINMVEALLRADQYVIRVDRVDMFKAADQLSVELGEIDHLRFLPGKVEHPQVFLLHKPYIPLPILFQVADIPVTEILFKPGRWFEALS